MTKTNPKISIIIPVYNGEKYVAQCIENMLCQTYKNLEIIVVDDGSTDSSGEIAEKYPIKIIRFEQNRGLSAARNAGIAAASGEYIHFMDVDDLLNLEYYEKMLEATLLTDAEIACSSFFSEVAVQTTNLFPDRLLLVAADDKILTTNVGRLGSACYYLFKKSLLLEKKLLFEEGRLIEDVAFSLQAVYEANKVVTVPNAVYYYKKREGSIIHQKDRAFVQKREGDRQRAKVFRDEFLQKHGLSIKPTIVQVIKYKFFGLALLKKVIYSNKIVRWYLFGINFLRRV
jgi:glycosyltransferase involved in cell wall biosynthesis